MQLQLAELRLGNYNRVFRQSELRTILVPGFRQKHAVPLCTARGDVVNVKHRLGKALVENARLDLKGNLVGDEVGFNAAKCSQGDGSSPKRHAAGDKRSGQCEDGNRKQNAATAN